PSRTARRSAAGPFAPNHSGGGGLLDGPGALRAAPHRPKPPPQGTRWCVPPPLLHPPPPRDPPPHPAPGAPPPARRPPLPPPRAPGPPPSCRSGSPPDGGPRPPFPAGADPHVDPAAAELVQRGQALGQVHRAVQGGHEHHAAQPQPLGARGRVAHRFERAELRR